MKKIRLIACACSIVIIAIVTVFGIINKENVDLEIIKDESCFSDFNVENDKVYIKCELKIKNISSKNKTFTLNAILKDDVLIGLIKNENLQGFNTELTENKFIIDPKTSNTFSVIFIGDFAGTNRKHDRNLPPITITEISN